MAHSLAFLHSLLLPISTFKLSLTLKSVVSSSRIAILFELTVGSLPVSSTLPLCLRFELLYSRTYNSLEGPQMAEKETPGSSEPHTKEEVPPTTEITPAEEVPPKSEPDACTTVMIAVSQCSKGYPKPSISSSHAFGWVLKNLIKPCCRKNYRLLILHVQVLDEDGLEELDSVYASPSDFQHMRDKERAKGTALIQTFVKQCNDAEIECEGWIKKGDPQDVICKEVKKKNPDILVLGSRGLGTLQSIFVAGVSAYVAKHVDCPVIVIKRDPKEIPDDPMDD